MKAPWEERFNPAMGVADAVLYEGYLLYPYRTSSCKNQFRWQFGVLAPTGFVAREEVESSRYRCEVRVQASQDAEVALCIRFLKVIQQHRSPTPQTPESKVEARPPATPLEEGSPVEFYLPPVSLGILEEAGHQDQLEVPSDAQNLRYPKLEGCGLIEDQPLILGVNLQATREPHDPGLWRLALVVENRTEVPETVTTRAGVIPYSTVGLHVLAGLSAGRFISSLEPPAHVGPSTSQCKSEGLYPVLMGEDGVDDILLCSPIVLYDHPALATTSKGNYFDATEIDEMLTLRVLTLTDDEKAEARIEDPRAAAILEMCEKMSPQDMMSLHGEMREVAPDSPWPSEFGGMSSLGDAIDIPWWDPESDLGVDPFSEVLILGGKRVRNGTLVRLHPSSGGDVQDLFLKGRVATVGGVFRDVDGGVHLGVTVNDDPGKDLFITQGRYLFFSPDEVEVVEVEP